MGQALYRKYRSRSLDEIIGQPHITTALSNALKHDTISHAYLFTGPRGTGKTSIARIMAHAINDLPYSDTPHLDIIEIDAASNRRIDEIRDLRERVHIAPTSATYKVYIIDEVHMLTKEAFNALLKTLEEPPKHVIFILATTESHKLPDTIISRTQRYTFKPVATSDVTGHLRSLAQAESITIDDDALQLIAHHGGGSFRDSISLLDQIRNQTSEITIRDVEDALGLAPQAMINELLATLQHKTPADIVNLLQKSRDFGQQPTGIAQQLSTELRQGFTTNQPLLPTEKLYGLLQDLLNISSSHDPDTALELALVAVVLDRMTPYKAKQTTPPINQTMQDTPPSKPSNSKTPPDAALDTSTQSAPKQPTSRKKHAAPNVTEESWQTALMELKKSHNTLYSVARMAVATIDNNELTLTFGFGFHHKRMQEAKNKQVITSVLENITGQPITIHCQIADKSKNSMQPQAPKQRAAEQTDTTTVSTISNIFGSAEVLE